MRLLRVMERLLEARKSAEVVCRMFFFLVEINYGPLGSGGSGELELLRRVRAAARAALSELRDCVGFNQGWIALKPREFVFFEDSCLTPV